MLIDNDLWPPVFYLCNIHRTVSEIAKKKKKKIDCSVSLRGKKMKIALTFNTCMHIRKKKSVMFRKYFKQGGRGVWMNEFCLPRFWNITAQWLVCQFQGGNIITTYEAINNRRGHLTVNSQSTQRQSLSATERWLYPLADWQVEAVWLACVSCVSVYTSWRWGVDEKSIPPGVWMDGDNTWHTHIHKNTQAHPHRTLDQSNSAINATRDPPLSCNNAKKKKKSSLPSSKYAWIKAWITMASCHLKTGLLLSNKQTYPSPGLIGLIKEVLFPLFPGALQRKGILKC